MGATICSRRSGLSAWDWLVWSGKALGWIVVGLLLLRIACWSPAADMLRLLAVGGCCRIAAAGRTGRLLDPGVRAHIGPEWFRARRLASWGSGVGCWATAEAMESALKPEQRPRLLQTAYELRICASWKKVLGGMPEKEEQESGREVRRSNWGFIIPHWIRAKRRSCLTAFVIAECSIALVVDLRVSRPTHGHLTSNPKPAG